MTRTTWTAPVALVLVLCCLHSADAVYGHQTVQIREALHDLGQGAPEPAYEVKAENTAFTEFQRSSLHHSVPVQSGFVSTRVACKTAFYNAFNQGFTACKAQSPLSAGDVLPGDGMPPAESNRTNSAFQIPDFPDVAEWERAARADCAAARSPQQCEVNALSRNPYCKPVPPMTQCSTQASRLGLKRHETSRQVICAPSCATCTGSERRTGSEGRCTSCPPRSGFVVLDINKKLGACRKYELGMPFKICVKTSDGHGKSTPYDHDVACTMMVQAQEVTRVKELPARVRTLPGMDEVSSGTGEISTLCNVLKRTICAKGSTAACIAAGSCSRDAAGCTCSLCKVKKTVQCEMICPSRSPKGGADSTGEDRKYWNYYLKHRHIYFDKKRCSRELCQADGGRFGSAMCAQVARMY